MKFSSSFIKLDNIRVIIINQGKYLTLIKNNGLSS